MSSILYKCERRVILESGAKHNGFILDHPLSGLESYYTGATWNRGQVDDPQYNAFYDAMRAATTVEELGKYSKEANLRIVEQHWQLWGPTLV